MRPYRGQHGYRSEIWPLAEHMILSEQEIASDQRVGDAVGELTRAHGRAFGSVLDRVFRFERYLILSAGAYVLFSLVLIALTQASASRKLSVFTRRSASAWPPTPSPRSSHSPPLAFAGGGEFVTGRSRTR